MKMKWDVELPNELLMFKDKIEETIRPYVEIKAKRASNLHPWQSKFGGTPYLPQGFAYPKDSKGRALLLLAQINFGEIPKLESFPETGIVQFYIAGAESLFGANFDDLTKQDNFRVVYFPEVTEDENQLVTDFAFLPINNFLPLRESCSLKFTLRYAPIPAVDYQFEDKIFGQHIEETTKGIPKRPIEYEIYDAYEKLFPSAGHKLGGYPYFTQHDPRVIKKYRDKNYMLLFQMDTDGEADIMWGDSGVGNFFIRNEDLQRRDFSRVLYTWDCL